MLFNLCHNDGTILLKLKENPLKKDENPTQKWIQGSSYDLGPGNELILCNLKEEGKMQVRYVLIDQDYFIIIEPDFSHNEDYKIKVHLKVPLKHIETMIDRTEPKNLIVGFATFTKASSKVSYLF